MKQLSPIQLLDKELYELEHNLEKSKEIFEKGSITLELHETHVKNLTPIIKKYKQAIQLLHGSKTITSIKRTGR